MPLRPHSDRPNAARRHARVVRSALAVGLSLVLLGCSSTETAAPDDEPVGYTRSPVPSVAGRSLPQAGTDVVRQLSAPDDGLQLLFFGFTSCPYECPTTLSKLKRAVQRLPEKDRDRVTVGLVSVDLARDTSPALAAYVKGILPGEEPEGVGLLAKDDAALREAAGALGASYSATPNSDGTPNITHTNEVYAVDDRGDVVRQWSFSTPADDLARELRLLLDGRRSLG